MHIALDRLAAHSRAALELLSLAAYFAPEPIPLTLFTTYPRELPDAIATVAADPLTFSTSIHLLRQHGLAHVEPTTLTLHRLIATILRTQPESQEDMPARAVRLLRAAIPADDPWTTPAAWPTWRTLLRHVLVATDPHRKYTGDEQDIAWLQHHAGEYLQTRGELAAAQALFEQALELRRAILGDDHPNTLESAGSLPFNLCELGRYEQARQLGEDTLARCRRILGPDHPQTLQVATSLSVALRNLGHYKQAYQLGEHTLARRRQVLPRAMIRTCGCASGRANLPGG